MKTRCYPKRPGSAIAAVVLLLVVANLTVISAITAGADDGESAALRVETLRAFYAAESGAMIVIRQLSRGSGVPGAGTTLGLPGGAAATFVSVPVEPDEHAVVVEGRAGFAVRRVQLAIE